MISGHTEAEDASSIFKFVLVHSKRYNWRSFSPWVFMCVRNPFPLRILQIAILSVYSPHSRDNYYHILPSNLIFGWYPYSHQTFLYTCRYSVSVFFAIINKSCMCPFVHVGMHAMPPVHSPHSSV